MGSSPFQVVETALPRSFSPLSPSLYAVLFALLDTITGLGRLTAEVLVAEIGVDMSRFPEALGYEVSLQPKTESAA